MRLFISWSGETSQRIALEVRKWLPLILPAVKPFLTVTDIEKGAKWQGDITTQLEQSDFGLMCLTRENLASQWVAFEAGALSKKLGGKVATVLFGLGHEDVAMPLAMFQGTLFGKAEIRQLLSSINGSASEGERRSNDEIDTLYPLVWPKIESPVNLILKNAAAAQPELPAIVPDYNAMVAELLGLVRNQATVLSSPERFLAPIIERMELQRAIDLERRTSQRVVETRLEKSSGRPRKLESEIIEDILTRGVQRIKDGLSVEQVADDTKFMGRKLLGVPFEVYVEGANIVLLAGDTRWTLETGKIDSPAIILERVAPSEFKRPQVP